MGLCTFKGGVHPYDGKDLSKDKPIQEYLPKGDLVYPLSQHIGAPAKPVVAVGDAVLKGQMIAEAGGFVSAPIYATVSGTVKAIEPRRVAVGDMVNSIVVENDGEFKSLEFTPVDDVASLSKEEIIKKIRWVRTGDNDIGFFPMDFQNDGEFVGGCIAGGRNYFHINAQGDAEPCVFIHFSDSNIHDKSILEMLQSPLFKAYHEGQPFNRNHLRPCPMLENPKLLREMVNKTGAKGTNAEAEETVEHLCSKCDHYAEEWGPVADRIWAEQKHKKPSYENYTEEKREHPELAAFEHADGSNGLRDEDIQ